MKVLLVNGSPHEKGCTYTALEEIAKTLKEEGVDSDFFQLGAKPVGGCMGCYRCGDLGRCVLDDKVNEFTILAKDYDGFVFGSPVHYAGIGGNIKSFMDRVFFSCDAMDPSPLKFKPAACIASARRAGTTATLDDMNKFPAYAQMPIVPSRYWNMVHGSSPEDVKKDEEGLQIMRFLARNMAWMLKMREAADAAGVELPNQSEDKIFTNFIR